VAEPNAAAEQTPGVMNQTLQQILPNISRNLHDSVTWKPTTGGSLLCTDLVACIEFRLDDRNQLAHHGLTKSLPPKPPRANPRSPDNGSNIDNPNIRVVAGAGCGGGRGAFA
jgi:hypothetical protein